MNKLKRIVILSSALFIGSLTSPPVLAEKSFGMVIEVNVEDRYVVLEDEITYTLPDNIAPDTIREGDEIEITWEWVEGLAVISSYRKKP